MPTLNLKPIHRPVKSYYAALDQFARLGVTHETAVRTGYQTLFEYCARQCCQYLVPEHALNPRRGNRSALEWIINQSRVKADRCSGIVNDLNRLDAPRCILPLTGKRSPST